MRKVKNYPLDSFSVIVPVFNREKFLPKTIDSISQSIDFFKQNYSRAEEVKSEIVVVNDASTDNTLALLHELASKNNLLKIINHSRNRGPGAARNTGVKNSEGRIIFFCDSDDIFLPQHVYLCLMLLQGKSENNSSFSLPINGQNYNINLPDRQVHIIKTGIKIQEPIHPSWKKLIANSSPINLCVRREYHEFIEGFPEDEIYHKAKCREDYM